MRLFGGQLQNNYFLEYFLLLVFYIDTCFSWSYSKLLQLAFTTASSLFVNCEQKFHIVFASRSAHAVSRLAWRLFKFLWLLDEKYWKIIRMSWTSIRDTKVAILFLPLTPLDWEAIGSPRGFFQSSWNIFDVPSFQKLMGW